MRLTDERNRERVRDRLARRYAGRPVLLGPASLASQTARVAELVAHGSRVLVLATGDGVGPLPPPGSCTVVPLPLPPLTSVTEEVRLLDRVVRSLPDDVVAAIEAFDPDREGLWLTRPFVSDEPVLGRPVTGGRPAAWAALEDKLRAEEIWTAAGVPHAPARVVPTDRAALAAATAELAGPLGAVWAGDAREGLHGSGDLVRWVGAGSGPSGRTDPHQAAAFAFFAARCDRVRVMPFLDGVPCSIHGLVLPDGTAALRPVEQAVLHSPGSRRFVPGGLSTWWDPPEADRAAMRDVVRRVGAHLASAHGYRGAFGVDGVLTAEGFRPTELNPRLSAGFSVVGAVDPALFWLLQAALLAGDDPGVGVADVESLVPLMDLARVGRPTALGHGFSVGSPQPRPVLRHDGRLVRSELDLGSRVVAADIATGCVARVEPCTLLRPGDRMAPLNLALMEFCDRELGTRFVVDDDLTWGHDPTGGPTRGATP